MSEKVVYKELHSYQPQSVDTLFKIYAKSKFNARVYFMNENSSVFHKTRLGVFEEPNGDFSIVYFRRNYGISKTSKMYNRESKVFSIIKKGNKFYFKNRLGIKPLIFNHLKSCEHYKLIISEMVSKLPWLRYLTEHDVIQTVSFNTIYSKKIFSLEKALKYQYKLPSPTSKLLHGLKTHSYQTNYLRYYIEYLVNIENLHNTLPTYDFGIFYDTVKMAKTLDRKVNCSWSARRLKEEHDAWSKEITDIVFTEGDRLMSIRDIFVKFADSSGFKLLRTTKEMNIEGRKNDHCVATYVNKVDSGSCGIYSINGYTLELNTAWITNQIPHTMVLQIVQFRGYKNCDAPEELYDMVKKELYKFNGIEVHTKLESIFDPGLEFPNDLLNHPF
jgi:hypothetical protein